MNFEFRKLEEHVKTLKQNIEARDKLLQAYEASILRLRKDCAERDCEIESLEHTIETSGEFLATQVTVNLDQQKEIESLKGTSTKFYFSENDIKQGVR